MLFLGAPSGQPSMCCEPDKTLSVFTLRLHLAGCICAVHLRQDAENKTTDDCAILPLYIHVDEKFFIYVNIKVFSEKQTV